MAGSSDGARAPELARARSHGQGPRFPGWEGPLPGLRAMMMIAAGLLLLAPCFAQMSQPDVALRSSLFSQGYSRHDPPAGGTSVEVAAPCPPRCSAAPAPSLGHMAPSVPELAVPARSADALGLGANRSSLR